MPNSQNSEARQIARDLAALAYDLASERMHMVFRRYGVEIKRYNPAQPRVPAKQQGAGQWTKTPSSGRAAAIRAGVQALGRRAAGVLAANPEAAPAAGAALLPGVIGGVGISRAAGLDAVVGGGGASQGMGMTPILGLPFKLEPPTNASMAGRLTPEQRKAVADECEPEYDDLVAACRKLGSPKTRAFCYEKAADWLSECIRRGGAAIRASSTNH